MARAEELPNDGGTDEARSTGDENPHQDFSLIRPVHRGPRRSAAGLRPAQASRKRHLVEIGDQPRPVGRHPSRSRVSALEAGRSHAGEHREPAEMLGGLLGRLGDDRYLQATADGLGDLPQRHALFRDRVIAGPGSAFLQRQPVETGGIERCTAGQRLRPSPT